MFEETLPLLSGSLVPPVIKGAAPLTEALQNGASLSDMVAALSGPFADNDAMLAASFDTSVLAFLSGRRDLGMTLQRDVLTSCRLFRLQDGPDIAESGERLRVLAFAAPGDLQMNMPIEFITHHLHVRLDVLYVMANQPLPDYVPDHDVAICVISDSDPDALMRLVPVLEHWPRPVLNNPGRIAGGRIENLTRDGIARLFEGAESIMAPPTVWRTRTEIIESLTAKAPLSDLLPGGDWPILVRPVGSHAGHLLERLNEPDELEIYVSSLSAERFYLSNFVDYRDPDKLYRKLRVALIDGVPFICHMAVSDHWMIHYVNAGMMDHEAKRQDEAQAMAAFDEGFAVRHKAAFAKLTQRLGFDYVILDCAEAPDGRLLLFEVEMAAIVHLLDPVESFAYKQPQMRRVFEAFSTMLYKAARLVSA